jgi:membrane-bound metal-dependent hydrolase YbcI (DUF457 family)
MSKVRGTVQPAMSFLKLPQKTSFKRILLASLFGIYLHILLDSPLYPDIRPFYPWELNPLLEHGMFVGFDMYTFCVLSFIGAAVVYAARLVFLKRTR